jgi:hypothetical protein
MARVDHQAAWAALFTLLTSAAAARADAPALPASAAPSAASAPPRAPQDGDTDAACDEAVAAWTARASQRTGLAIVPATCPLGLVRLAVVGAGCDFEVSRDRGFQRTPSGAFGVSPIVSLDWDTAPPPMKTAFAGLLTALTEDPSLPMGQKRPSSLRWLGARSTQLAVGAGAALLAAGAAAFAWTRRKRRKATPLVP